MAVNEIKQIRIHRMKSDFIRLYFVEFCFSPDYRSISKNGVELYRFTIAQAQIIEILVNHLEMGHSSVPQQTILGTVGRDELCNTRLRDYFRDHTAWGILIKTTGGRDASVYLDFNCLV